MCGQQQIGFRGKFIALNVYIRKDYIRMYFSYEKNVSFHLMN